MDFLAYFIHLIAAHPFGFMGFVFVFIFGSATMAPKEKMPAFRKLSVFLGILMVLNFILGSRLNGWAIYAVGETGDAQVTGKEETSTQYNDQNVYRFNILLKTKDGKVVETYFRTDDFNVYPVHNSVTYPSTGDRFHVRYLRHFPSAFIILANDDSPWASNLKCAALQSRLNEAQNKYQFDRGNQTYRRQYIELIRQVIDSHCYTDSIDLQKYWNDIEYVKKGKDLNTN